MFIYRGQGNNDQFFHSVKHNGWTDWLLPQLRLLVVCVQHLCHHVRYRGILEQGLEYKHLLGYTYLMYFFKLYVCIYNVSRISLSNQSTVSFMEHVLVNVSKNSIH